MAPAVPVLALAGASKRFGQRQALAPTDLAIAEAETVVLIGPSGCGKTTVLRLLLGLVRPDAGEVRFRDVAIDRAPPARLRAVRQRMGYVVQEGGLFPHLTAAGNVALMARHLGWPPARIAARIDELAALTRLPGEALSRYPGELSGGQRQRVGLMRALMLDPEALLLDEPLGALDPLVRAELQEDLLAVFRQLRKSVVLVTHDLAEAAFFADRLVLMRDGRIVQQGRARELVDRAGRSVRHPLRGGPAPLRPRGAGRSTMAAPMTRIAIVALALAAVAGPASAEQRPLRVASKSFTESVILGEIASLLAALGRQRRRAPAGAGRHAAGVGGAGARRRRPLPRVHRHAAARRSWADSARPPAPIPWPGWPSGCATAGWA